MAVTPSRKVLVSIVALAVGSGSVNAACRGDDDSESVPTTVPAAETTTSDDVATTMTDTTMTASTSAGTSPTTSAVTSTNEPTTTTVATTSTTTTATTATTATTESVPAEVTSVSVYWGSIVVNPEAGSPERIGAGAREVAADVPVRNSLEAMFQGPNAVERTIGMTTSVPPGTTVLGIAVDGTTATVDLSPEFASPGGSLDETMRLAQVVFTVTQFDEIDRVQFHIDGMPQDPILSGGFVVGDGLTRDSFVNVRAPITIEQPYPGADITDPLVIRGESNTFEATVRYAVTAGDGDGVVMAEGFDTATGGNGTWGTFEVVVDLADLADYRPGPGSVIMWQDSPLDGTRVDVVEIPIVLPER